jgi:hypothetical protein
MRGMKALLPILALLIAAMPAQAAPLSSAARVAFVREHPCPSTGKPRGACPGHVVDHVQPLCAGDADDKSNMQWQTVDDAARKDKTERAQCRRLRRAG